LEANATMPLNADEVFNTVEQDRVEGSAVTRLTRASVYYEASRSQPGLLDQVHSNGQRMTGRFHDGQFIPVEK